MQCEKEYGMSRLVMFAVGLVLGYAVVSLVTETKVEASESTSAEQVVLGHRIGPAGQEMLVVR